MDLVIADGVEAKIDDLCLKKKYWWLCFMINLKKKEVIEIDEANSCPREGKENNYDHEKFKSLCGKTLAKEARYFLIDFPKHADGKPAEGSDSNMFLIQWNPESGPIRPKMVYGSAYVSFKSKYSAKIKNNMEATAERDVDLDKFLDKYKVV
eukprot:g45867.t1